MLTLVGISIVFVIVGYALDYYLPSSSFWNKWVGFLIVGGWALGLCGPIASIAVSSIRASALYEPCIPEQSVILNEAVVTDGEALYKVNPNRILLVPCGLPDYEKVDEAPAGFCTVCMTIRDSRFCTDCGTYLFGAETGNNSCPNCGTACSSNFCGNCGIRIEHKER